MSYKQRFNHRLLRLQKRFLREDHKWIAGDCAIDETDLFLLPGEIIGDTYFLPAVPMPKHAPAHMAWIESLRGIIGSKGK